MKTYRVGVVGCGAVWKYHSLVYGMSDRLACACVYDPVEERTQAAAALTGARPAASAEEVLTAEDVDIVAVLSPAFTHADYVEIGAAAGKHFMLEKPM
ncbi:MAG: Gfo/Idh/MocA family oxidoreductase, partial [Victivallales bacterium]|nr:Gfo/Idh/MocA family oxidoreductase [Victivallales bacterium]